MDKYLNEAELKLLELMENFDFNELNEEDQKFVLSHISKEEYVLRRTIISNGTEALNEEVHVTPLPLSTATSIKNHHKQIPIYQAFIMTGAAAVLMFLIMFQKNDSTSILNETRYVTQHDTVILDKIVTDTVFTTVYDTTYLEKEIFVPDYSNDKCEREEPRLLDIGPVKPFIFKEDIVSPSGKSLMKDESASLINELEIETGSTIFRDQGFQSLNKN